MTTFAIVVSAAASVAFGAVEPDPAADAAEVASGLVSRTLEMKGGRILGRSYKTADGTEFMRGGSPEFAFRVDGRLYSGRSSWKDARVAKRTAAGGARTTTVTAASSDGKVGIELAYTTYPAERAFDNDLCETNIVIVDSTGDKGYAFAYYTVPTTVWTWGNVREARQYRHCEICQSRCRPQIFTCREG